VTGPVTFACSGNAANGQGTLIRYWNYGFPPDQVDPRTRDGVNGVQLKSAVLASNVFGCQFSVSTVANQQAGLVGLAIALARPDPSAAGNTLETATLVQQVHLDNTP
jgi:MSHA biogenesis protein MshO